MANTSEHISIRLPKELLRWIDDYAKSVWRSRSSAILEMLYAAQMEAADEWEQRGIPERPFPDKPGKLVFPTKNEHALTCKCLMCRPPKP